MLRALAGVVSKRRQTEISNPSNPSFLFVETFDSIGYDNSWTEAGATIDGDYTGDVLEGTQSLRLTASGTAPRVFAGLSSATTRHVYSQLKLISYSGGTTTVLYTLRATGTVLLSIIILADGKLRIQHGSSTADTVDSLPINTKIHLWFSYVAGAGSDGTAYVAWSTNGIRPNSGNRFASLSNGTSSSSLNRIYCGTTTNSNYEVIMDRVIIAATDIYDNP